jgi:hypothetical protein
MNALILSLQEAGIVKAISLEEAENANLTFDVYFPEIRDLSHPEERLQHATEVLQAARENLRKLRYPGVSICQACEKITIDALRGKEGYIHSENYWALVASADQCPVCLMMVKALRARHPLGDCDVAMALLSPFRTDLQVSLRAASAKQVRTGSGDSSALETLEVSIRNMHPLLPSGILTTFALPGRSIS